MSAQAEILPPHPKHGIACETFGYDFARPEYPKKAAIKAKYRNGTETSKVCCWWVSGSDGGFTISNGDVQHAALKPYRWALLDNPRTQHEPIICTEGEADADALIDLGFVATDHRTLTDAHAEWFRNRDVVVVQDRDPPSSATNGSGYGYAPSNQTPGERHAERAVRLLRGVSKRLAVFRFPGDGVKDARDWCRSHPSSNGTKAAVLRPLFLQALDQQQQQTDDWADCLPSKTAARREYPAVEEFVQGFLTVGLTVLAATPKAGKTWLTHEFALAIALGSNALGILPCQQAEVLAIYAEDNERRGIMRERALIGHDDGCAGLTYAWAGCSWNLERLARWTDAHPKCRVIIIDTAERWKQMQPPAETSGRVYADEYRFWGDLQRFAISRSIALVLIHHDRKPNGSGGNVLDTVSGTRAITGSADHIWLLDRDKDTGISTLNIIGRDLDEKSVQFNRSVSQQLRAVERPVNDAVARMEQRAKARKMREDGLTFVEIARALGVAKSTVQAWCHDENGK